MTRRIGCRRKNAGRATPLIVSHATRRGIYEAASFVSSWSDWIICAPPPQLWLSLCLDYYTIKMWRPVGTALNYEGVDRFNWSGPNVAILLLWVDAEEGDTLKRRHADKNMVMRSGWNILRRIFGWDGRRTGVGKGELFSGRVDWIIYRFDRIDVWLSGGLPTDTGEINICFLIFCELWNSLCCIRSNFYFSSFYS